MSRLLSPHARLRMARLEGESPQALRVSSVPRECGGYSAAGLRGGSRSRPGRGFSRPGPRGDSRNPILRRTSACPTHNKDRSQALMPRRTRALHPGAHRSRRGTPQGNRTPRSEGAGTQTCGARLQSRGRGFGREHLKRIPVRDKKPFLGILTRGEPKKELIQVESGEKRVPLHRGKASHPFHLHEGLCRAAPVPADEERGKFREDSPHGACRAFCPAGPGEDPPVVPRIEVDEKTRFGPGLHPENKGGFTGYPVTAPPVDVPA